MLFDRFFTSAAGGSVWNHMYWVTGTPGNPKDRRGSRTGGFGNLPTIFDRLEEAGVSWKFYVQNYDPRITFRSRQASATAARRSSGCRRSTTRATSTTRSSSATSSTWTSTTRTSLDGTLPAVAYMAPSGSSEHPPGSIQAGERFVRTLINALIASTDWKDSAFMWTLRRLGRLVRPRPAAAGGQVRLRLPRARAAGEPLRTRGYIDHTTLDFTSELKFIEENWNLKPLATRDAHAKSIMGAFDFSQTPRSPTIVAAVRGVKPPATPKRSIVYPAYILAFLLTAILIVVAARRSGRRGPPERPSPPDPSGPSGPPSRREPLPPVELQPAPAHEGPGSPPLPKLPPRRRR